MMVLNEHYVGWLLQSWFFIDFWLSKPNIAISLMSPISRSIVSAIVIWYSKYCLKLKKNNNNKYIDNSYYYDI